MFFITVIAQFQTLLKSGYINGFRSLNTSQIFMYEKISELDTDSKSLEQEWSRSRQI